MANVRATNGTSDNLYLNGSGSALNTSGWGVMWVGRLMTLAGTEAIFTASNTNTSIGVLYYDATNEVMFGNPNGDTNCSLATLNTTDVWLLGFTHTSAGQVRFHIANLTTGAAAVHGDGEIFSSGVVPVVTSAWNRTQVGSGDDGTFRGGKRHAAAAVFASVYTDANFNSVASAKTTASIHSLTPSRLWDLNQASTATAVVNLETGSADQASITGTSVVADTAFDIWTFGLGSGGSTVTDVPAAGSGDVPAPAVAASSNVTAVPAAGIGDVPAPTASGSSSADGGVTAVPAAGIGDVPTPAMSADAAITAVPAAGIGDVPAASMAISVEVGTGPASGIGDVPAPAVSATASDGTVTDLPAVGIGDVPAPSIVAGANVIAAPDAGVGTVPTPTVSGTSSADATVAALPAEGIGDVPAPALAADATVAAVPAAGIGDVPAPVATAPDASVAATPLHGIGDVPAPVVTGDASTPTPGGSLLLMGAG